MPQQDHFRIAATLFLASFLTYACFLQTPSNANVSSRMFLTLSLVGYGDLSIDRYAARTIDKAESRGKLYSDKAPGLSLLAVPVTALLWRPIIAYDRDHTRPPADAQASGWPPAYELFTYFATLSTSALITAISVAALFLLALNVFGNPGGATLVALAYGFATPAFGWATAFLGHAPAMGLVVTGFACLHFLRHPGPAVRRDYLLVIAGAACLTWAVVTEFTAAPVALAVAVYGFTRTTFGKDQLLLLAACALVTGLAFALPLLIYNNLAFGAPWRLGYQSVQGFPGTKQGFLGLGNPSLNVLFEIIGGARRGILLICPLLLLVPVGLIHMSMLGEQRRLAILITFIVAYYLLLNSSYYYWDGGWSTGPRHITGMLPFACLALGAVWNSAGKCMRAFVLLLVLASSALALMCASTDMFAPDDIGNLLFEVVIPRFLGGYSTAVPVPLFGWRPRYFLLGLLVAWICIGLIIARQLGRSQRVAVPGTSSPLDR